VQTSVATTSAALVPITLSPDAKTIAGLAVSCTIGPNSWVLLTLSGTTAASLMVMGGVHMHLLHCSLRAMGT
jgi:hypothetical protein